MYNHEKRKLFLFACFSHYRNISLMKRFTHFIVSRNLYGFLFLMMSFGVWGQTTLVNYQFNNNLDPDAGAIGSPSLMYYDASDNPVTPNYNANRLHLESSDEGDYIELTFDATGYQNLTLSWKGQYSGAWLGSGEWTLQTFNGSTWVNSQVMNLNIINSSRTVNVALPASYDGNATSKIRIKATNIGDGWIFDANLYLDNLKITSGSPKIKVYTNGNVHIPHQSAASIALNTDFGTRQTTDLALARGFRIRNFQGQNGSKLIVSDITITGANPGDFTVSAITLPAAPLDPTNSETEGSSTYRSFNINFLPLADGLRTAEVNIYSNAAPSPYTFTVVGTGASCALERTSYAENKMDLGQQTLLADNLTSTDLIAGEACSPTPNIGRLWPSDNIIFSQNCNTNNDPALYTSASSSWYTRYATKSIEFGGENGLDISKQKNVAINFRIAAFSTAHNRGVTSSDFISLSVLKPDNTWSEEIRLIGSPSSSNYINYDFSGGNNLTGTYDGNNIPTQDNNREPFLQSKVHFKQFTLNIPASALISNLKFKITAHSSNNNRLWLIDDVKVLSDNAVFKTYTTSSVWVPSGNPSPNEKVIIEGDYDVPGAGLNVCECEVAATGSVRIRNDRQVTVRGKVTNHGSGDNFVINTGGNLIQIENDAENSGDIKVEKLFTFVNGPVPANDRKQYNFVISPVVDQELKEIYHGEPDVMEYREHTNRFYNYNGGYVAGKGFAIKEPSKSAVPSTTVTANFRGVPFNGTLEYPLNNSNPGNNDFGYNLIGNPYPSNLDIEALYDNNSTVITPTFYFWDNRGNTLYTQQGSDYNGSNYAIYNAISGAGVGAGQAADGAPDNTRVPNRYVKVGTAFMVQALGGDESIRFDNSMRSKDNSGPSFFGKNGSSFSAADYNNEDRYWLALTTMSGMEVMNAIVYFNEGNNEYGLEDSDALGSSDEIFSIVDQQYLAINGRASFEVSDIVPLGVRLFESGRFKIEIEKREGIFATSQRIFLKDKYLNILHNLSQDPYEFESEAGEFIDRFEIHYKIPGASDTVLTASSSNHLKIIKENHQIVVNSSRDKIIGVEVFNLSGWSIYKKDNVNAREHRIPAQTLGVQILIVNVLTETGEIVSRKFINK